MKDRDDIRKELYYIIHVAFFETVEEKQKALSRCMKTLKDIEINLRLLLGLSTSNPNVAANMEAKVENVPGVQNIFSFSEDEMQRIQNISNDNEEFLDKL